MACVVLLAPRLAAAQSQLCIPTGSWMAPIVDGEMTDPGWVQASRYVHANGTGNPHGAVQAEWIGSDLYVALEAHNDPAIGANDVAVLAFGASPDARMLEMQIATGPIIDCTTTAGGSRPATVTWRTAGTFSAAALPRWTWTSGSSGDPGAAVLPIMFRCYSGGSADPNSSWSVEVKLPASMLPTAPFPFYAAIIRDGINSTTAAELTWPPSTTAVDNQIVDQITNLPDPVGWGTARKSAADCPGMYVASWSNKIRVNGNASHVIQPGQLNTFEVWVSNNGSKSYDKIKAAFFYQRFGINAGGWTAIPPPATTPTYGPETTVGAGSATAPAETKLDGPSWNVPATEPSGHACVTVALDQGPSAAVPAEFQTRGGVENMEFGVTSRFSGAPVVSAAGLKPPPGATKVRLALQLSPDLRFMRADGRSPVPRGTPVARLNVPVHGYRLTGRYLELDGRKLEIVEPVSSFAYVLDHALDPRTKIPPVDVAAARMRLGPFPAGADPFALSERSRDVLAGPISAAIGEGSRALPKISLGNYAIGLDGLDRKDPGGRVFYVDLAPDEARTLSFAAELQEDGKPECCGCKRISGTTAAFLFVGLAALRPRPRRRT